MHRNNSVNLQCTFLVWKNENFLVRVLLYEFCFVNLKIINLKVFFGCLLLLFCCFGVFFVFCFGFFLGGEVYRHDSHLNIWFFWFLIPGMIPVRGWRVWILCGCPKPMPYRGGAEQGGWPQGCASTCSPVTASITTSRNSQYQVSVNPPPYQVNVNPWPPPNQ